MGTRNYTSTGERVQLGLSGVNLIKLATAKEPPRNDWSSHANLGEINSVKTLVYI